MKGTRVQSIIRELRGEKIDIVEFSEDPVAFVTQALSPAKTQRVQIVDDREHVMEVVVEDKQLSLAIGKKGQNVRLAAKLTGWRIDIKSEEEKRREVEAQFEGLEAAPAEERRRGRAGGAAARRPRQATPAALRTGRRRREDGSEARRGGLRFDRGRRGRDGRTAVGSAGYRRKDGRQDSVRRARRVAGAGIRRAVCRGASFAIHGRTTGVTFGHCPDLQGRGTAGHHQPGSDRAAQARPRHRGQERVEHDRRGRGPSVRRADGATAQHPAAERRHLRRDAGREGQEARAVEEGTGAGQAGRADAAAAAPRQDGEARAGAGFGRRGRRRGPARGSRARAGRDARTGTHRRARTGDRSPMCRVEAPVETPRRAEPVEAAAAPEPPPSRRRRASSRRLRPSRPRRAAWCRRRCVSASKNSGRRRRRRRCRPRRRRGWRRARRPSRRRPRNQPPREHWQPDVPGPRPVPASRWQRARAARPARCVRRRPDRPRCRWAVRGRCRRSPFARRSPGCRRGPGSTRSVRGCRRGRRISSVRVARDGRPPASGAIRGRRRRRCPPRLRRCRAPSRSPRA